MSEIDTLLNRLQDLNAQEEAYLRRFDAERERLIAEQKLSLTEQWKACDQTRQLIGAGVRKQIFATLDQLLALYPDLPSEDQGRVRAALKSLECVSLAEFVKYQALFVNTAADAERLNRGLTAALIQLTDGSLGAHYSGKNPSAALYAEGFAKLESGLPGALDKAALIQQLENSLNAHDPRLYPLNDLYAAAYDADLNPEQRFAALVARVGTRGAEELQVFLDKFPNSPLFAEQTTRRPAPDMNTWETLFDARLRAALVKLLDLASRAGTRHKAIEREVKRMVLADYLEDHEARPIAERNTPTMPGGVFAEPLWIVLTVYLDLSLDQQQEIAAVCRQSLDLLDVIDAEGKRYAAHIQGPEDEALVRYALVAAAITDGSFDYRDELLNLGELYRVAYAAGLDPAPIFKEVGTKLFNTKIENFVDSAHLQQDVRRTLRRNNP